MRAQLIRVLAAFFVLAASHACDRPQTKPADSVQTPSASQPVRAARSRATTQAAATRHTTPDRLGLLEAVLRYQFDHNASGRQRNVDYFFVSVERDDELALLVPRLADVRPKVV